jgi:2-dehydropantoate 2-reductase
LDWPAPAGLQPRGDPVRVCIFGAGAIGGHVGALLAHAGIDVTLIARGPHLAAMRDQGLRLILESGEEIVTRPACTDDPADAGPQDYVIITLKAHSVPGVVDRLAPLLGPDTTVVPAVNGIPWWYFHGVDGPYRDRRIAAVDPGDRQWNTIGPERVIGCVVWTSAEIVEPGVIRHTHGNRMPLGEPDGSRSERALRLSRAMSECGLKSPVRPRIRNEIWMKLWGNLAFNPVSALTHATLDVLATDPGCVRILRQMMLEGQAVGEALGAEFAIDVDARIRAAGDVGAHRTSMLQDLEQGRPMEIDALVTAVSELGRVVGVPTPTIDLVNALVIRRAREAGCYPDRAAAPPT